MGLFFVLVEWYLLSVGKVCADSLDDLGMPTFYSSALAWAWFGVVLAVGVCVAGNCFRRRVSIEVREGVCVVKNVYIYFFFYEP